MSITDNKNLYNLLEPVSFLEAFIKHPPEGFKTNLINIDSGSIYGFIARLNLLTTVDDSIKEFADKLKSFLPVEFVVKNFLSPLVLFVGTTITEYCVFSSGMNIKAFIKELNRSLKCSKKLFMIIKDIPIDSPLLSEEENKFSASLTKELEKNGFISVSGQALGYVPINFSTLEEFFSKFNSKRRNDFKRKLKARENVIKKEFNTGDSFFTDEIVKELHKQYLDVFFNSNVQFDQLSLPYFKEVLQNNKDGKVFIDFLEDKILAFNLCFVGETYLLDKYRGCIYPESQNYCLYFNQIFDNINYCLKNNLKLYIIGGAAPAVKAYMGAQFTYTIHAVYINNKLLRLILNKFRHLFEADKNVLEDKEKDN